MKDIKLETPFMKIQYFIAWFGFIFFGYLIVWLIALFLANYGKDTSLNKPKKNNLLNKSYQKLIFWYGSITGDISIIAFFIAWIIQLIN